MSDTLTSDRQTVADSSGSRGVPFGRLVKAEMRKLVDTRAGKWLLIAIVGITLLVVVIMLFAADPKNLTYDKLVDYTQTPQKILLPVLGILAITSEWSQRTGLVTFTLEPNRGRVLLAKVSATLIFGLFVIATAFAAAAIGNVLGAALRDGDGSWAFGVSGVRDIVIVQLTGLIQGLAFGMMLLISAAAIVLYYVLPNVWNLLFRAVSGLKDVAPWIDLNTAQEPLYTHEMDGRAWAQFLVAALVWIAVPLVIGLVRVLRSEVKSA